MQTRLSLPPGAFERVLFWRCLWPVLYVRSALTVLSSDISFIKRLHVQVTVYKYPNIDSFDYWSYDTRGKSDRCQYNSGYVTQCHVQTHTQLMVYTYVYIIFGLPVITYLPRKHYWNEMKVWKYGRLQKYCNKFSTSSPLYKGLPIVLSKECWNLVELKWRICCNTFAVYCKTTNWLIWEWNALKCQEPSPAFMQMSTCAYLISTCGIRRACHFSHNGWE